MNTSDLVLNIAQIALYIQHTFTRNKCGLLMPKHIAETKNKAVTITVMLVVLISFICGHELYFSIRKRF